MKVPILRETEFTCMSANNLLSRLLTYKDAKFVILKNNWLFSIISRVFFCILQIRLLQLASVRFAKGMAKEITARSKCCSQDCYA